MFAIPFGRIFWKEYRVHRSLWLCCALIGIAFELFAWFLTLFGPWNHHLQSFEVILTLFPIMYAIGCGALLFACEREERTSDWLALLATPPNATLCAKFAFAVLSMIGLQLCLGVPVLTVAASYAVRSGNDPMSFLPTILHPFGLIVLVSAILGSLMSRRVMTSVAGMVFWWVITVLSPIIVLQYWLGPRWDVGLSWRIALSFLLMAVLSADIWLGWRWCEGKYFDGDLIEDANAKFQDWVKRLIGRTATATRVPARAEYEQGWQRTWQRLVWQERQRESAHLAILILGCVLGFTFAVISWQKQQSFTAMVLMLNWAVPLVMGVYGFRSDIGLQQPRFLVNRGISPASLWLSKHYVWLPRAFWITAVIFFVSLVCERRFFQVAPESLGNAAFQDFYATMISPHTGIWIVMIGYCCGQLAAILFQRVIIAIAVGAVLNIIMTGWYTEMARMSIPLWWSVGIPVVAMFLITLWQMRPWMLEEHSWLRRWKLISVLSAVPFLIVTAVSWHRVAEASALPLLDPNQAGQWQALLSRQRAFRTLTTDEAFVQQRIDQLSRGRSARESETTDQVIELMKRDLRTLGIEIHSQRELDIWSLTSDMLKRAEEHAAKQQLDKALECYLACLKLARLTATGGHLYGTWIKSTASKCAILEGIVKWANHSSQTPVAIQEAIKTIESELLLFPSASEAVAASYLIDRQLVEGFSTIGINAYVVDINLVNHSWHEFGPWIIFPAEQKRFGILMDREAESLFTSMSSLENELLLPKQGITGVRAVSGEQWLQNPRETKTSPLLEQVLESRNRAAKQVLQRQTEIRAAFTRMELIAYRLEHGKLPDRLIELMETTNGTYLRDPWTGRFFEFYPTFLLSPGSSQETLVPVTSGGVEFQNNRTKGSFLRFLASQVASETHSFFQFPRTQMITSGQGPILLDSTVFPIPVRSESDTKAIE